MTNEEKQKYIDAISTKMRSIAEECDENLQFEYDVLKLALAALTAQPVKVDDSMALAFHKALNDGGVGHEDLEEIKVGLEAALCNIPRPAPVAEPAGLVPVPPEFLSAEQNSQGMFELSEDCMTRLAIALSQQAKGLVIKPGHALVPVEPTAAMYEAGDQQLTTKQVWYAMLAAAPEVVSSKR